MKSSCSCVNHVDIQLKPSIIKFYFSLWHNIYSSRTSFLLILWSNNIFHSLSLSLWAYHWIGCQCLLPLLWPAMQPHPVMHVQVDGKQCHPQLLAGGEPHHAVLSWCHWMQPQPWLPQIGARGCIWHFLCSHAEHRTQGCTWSCCKLDLGICSQWWFLGSALQLVLLHQGLQHCVLQR